jgi:hypothetical protein
MRVIEQLARLFWDRGQLNTDEALHLVRHGFAPLAAFDGLELPQPPLPPRQPRPQEVEIDPDLYEHFEGDEGCPEWWYTGDDDWNPDADAECHQEELSGRRRPRKKMIGAGRRHRKAARRKRNTLRAVAARCVAAQGRPAATPADRRAALEALHTWAWKNRHRKLAAALLRVLTRRHPEPGDRNAVRGLPEVRALSLP